jgi:hypothetical protein
MLEPLALKYNFNSKMSEIVLELCSETEPTPMVEAVVPQKRGYTMSDSKRDQLVKARARALELRTALNAIKPPKVKPVKIKKPSKLELEISKIKKQTEELEPVTEPVAEPIEPVVTEAVVVKEPIETKQKVLVKKQKEAPIKQRKPLMVTQPPITPPPPTPPPTGFRRNAFGFFVI